MEIASLIDRLGQDYAVVSASLIQDARGLFMRKGVKKSTEAAGGMTEENLREPSRWCRHYGLDGGKSLHPCDKQCLFIMFNKELCA